MASTRGKIEHREYLDLPNMKQTSTIDKNIALSTSSCMQCRGLLLVGKINKKNPRAGMLVFQKNYHYNTMFLSMIDVSVTTTQVLKWLAPVLYTIASTQSIKNGMLYTAKKDYISLANGGEKMHSGMS